MARNHVPTGRPPGRPRKVPEPIIDVLTVEEEEAQLLLGDVPALMTPHGRRQWCARIAAGIGTDTTKAFRVNARLQAMKMFSEMCGDSERAKLEILREHEELKARKAISATLRSGQRQTVTFIRPDLANKPQLPADNDVAAVVEPDEQELDELLGELE